MKPWHVILIACIGYSVSTVSMLLLSLGILLHDQYLSGICVPMAILFLFLSSYGWAYSLAYKRHALPLERVGNHEASVWLQLHFLFWTFSLVDFFIIVMAMVGIFGTVLNVPLTLATFASPLVGFALLYALSFFARTGFSDFIGMGYQSVVGYSPIGTASLAAFSTFQMSKGDQSGVDYLGVALDGVIDDYREDRIQSSALSEARIVTSVGGFGKAEYDQKQLKKLQTISEALKEYPNVQPALAACFALTMDFPWVSSFKAIPEAARTRYDTATILAALAASTAAVISLMLNLLPREQLSGLYATLMSSTTAALLLGIALMWFSLRAFRGMRNYLIPLDAYFGLGGRLGEGPSPGDSKGANQKDSDKKGGVAEGTLPATAVLSHLA